MPKARIQQRHGQYSSINRTTVLPDEIVIVDSGHPDTSNGKALYYRALTGDPIRVPNADEVGDVADGSITSSKIEDGAVIGSKLGSDSVTTDKIADDSVTPEKLSQKYSIVQNVQFIEAGVDPVYPSVDTAIESDVLYLCYNSGGALQGHLIFNGDKNFVSNTVSQILFRRTGAIEYRTGTAASGTVTWASEWRSITADLIPKTREIAGIDLQDDITAAELLTALGLDSVSKVQLITPAQVDTATENGVLYHVKIGTSIPQMIVCVGDDSSHRQTRLNVNSGTIESRKQTKASGDEEFGEWSEWVSVVPNFIKVIDSEISANWNGQVPTTYVGEPGDLILYNNRLWLLAGIYYGNSYYHWVKMVTPDEINSAIEFKMDYASLKHSKNDLLNLNNGQVYYDDNVIGIKTGNHTVDRGQGYMERIPDVKSAYTTEYINALMAEAQTVITNLSASKLSYADIPTTGIDSATQNATIYYVYEASAEDPKLYSYAILSISSEYMRTHYRFNAAQGRIEYRRQARDSIEDEWSAWTEWDTDYYTKSDIDSMIGNVEALLSQV